MIATSHQDGLCDRCLPISSTVISSKVISSTVEQKCCKLLFRCADGDLCSVAECPLSPPSRSPSLTRKVHGALVQQWPDDLQGESQAGKNQVWT